MLEKANFWLDCPLTTKTKVVLLIQVAQRVSSCNKPNQKDHKGVRISFTSTCVSFLHKHHPLLFPHRHLLPKRLKPNPKKRENASTFCSSALCLPSHWDLLARSQWIRSRSGLTILVRSPSVPTPLIPRTDSAVSHLEQQRVPFTRDAARWLWARQADRWGLCNPCALMERINWVSF